MAVTKNTGKFDDRKLRALISRLEEAKRLSVVVGIPASANAPRGDSNSATIAAVHEFGATITVTPKMRGFLGAAGLHLKKSTTQITIPERSFLRSTTQEHGKEAAALLAKSINEALFGDGDMRKPFELTGSLLAGLSKKKIQSGIEPKNSDFTVARKKSSRPLIDTGQLVQSITWEVRSE